MGLKQVCQSRARKRKHAWICLDALSLIERLREICEVSSVGLWVVMRDVDRRLRETGGRGRGRHREREVEQALRWQWRKRQRRPCSLESWVKAAD